MLTQEKWLLDANLSSIALDKWQQHINLLARLFRVPSCMVLQQHHDGFQILITNRNQRQSIATGGFVPWGMRSLHRQVLEANRELYVPNAILQECWSGFEETENGVVSYLGLPLCWPNGVPFGVLCIMDSQPTDYRDPYFELMNSFKQQIEADLQLLVNEQEISELALLDDMTGVYNRRGFNTLAEYKLSVAKRYGHSFGLMYFDLDNLQDINVQLGRNIGDQAIMALADALNSELRDCDIAARIGDDEFAALVFVRQEEDLENLAVRIQRKINLIKQQRDSLPPITTSVGAKCYTANTELDISHMLNEVDKLMFNIKHQKKIASGSGYNPSH